MLRARRFASPIAAPGARLLARVPLRFFQRRAGRARLLGFELPLVPFVDCLLGIVLFLLASFSASDTCGVRERVPSAENTSDNVDAPIVSVSAHQVSVDGSPVAETSDILAGGRLTRLDELFNTLKNKRELWKQLNPEAEFPGVVLLEVERNVPSLVVKSAFQSAAYAGYPQVSFVVKRR